MMIKRVFVLLFIGSLNLNLFGDWKTEVSALIVNRDYKGAIDLLLRNSQKDIPNPTISGLLAYSYNRLKNKNEEYKWLQEYFEYYRGTEIIFIFLDASTYGKVSDYIMTWKRKYPLITAISLIDSEDFKRPIPPNKIVVGIDIENPAYYKLSEDNKIIKGGLLNRGYNSFSLAARELFENSGSHIYLLDLKVEDLYLKKELEIDIQIDSQVTTKKTEVTIKDIKYNLSLFIGDELIISSQKLHHEKVSWKFEIPAPTANLSPMIPPEKIDPSKVDYTSNSFSIPAAVAGILQLIKGIKKKDSAEEKASYFQRTKQLTTTFIRRNREGLDKEVNAIIRLKTSHLK